MSEDRKIDCICTRKRCKRHGDCKACMEFHERNKVHGPAQCKRNAENPEKKLSNINEDG